MYVDYKTCIYLESLNLSYKEMCEMFIVKVSPNFLCKKFKEYGIHHKCKCERIYEEVKNSSESLNKLARKHKVSRRSVCNIRKKVKENVD